jgi:hypothetical protein
MDPTQAVQILEAMRKKHQDAQRRYYERTKEQRRLYAKQYYETHKDAVIERVKRNQRQRKEAAAQPPAALSGFLLNSGENSRQPGLRPAGSKFDSKTFSTASVETPKG